MRFLRCQNKISANESAKPKRFFFKIEDEDNFWTIKKSWIYHYRCDKEYNKGLFLGLQNPK